MIDTERLTLRGWREDDAAQHHAMRNDPDVRRYLGPPTTLDDSHEVIARQRALLETLGYCFWVIERRADGAFLGWCGFKPGPEGTPIAALPEIGWSLTSAAWGQGYALEAARGALAWAWPTMDWPSIHAITVPANTASWGLMQRLGMTRVEGADFNHPALAEGDPLRLHLLYRIDRP